MARSQFSKTSKGFTLMEVVVSIAILMVGAIGAATLLAKTYNSTSYSEYLVQAATLASEKLEDLNRYPSGDPDVAVTSGTTAGSLTADTDGSVTSNSVTETVDYFDEVFMDPTAGSISETVATGTSPNFTYTTTTHNPNGTITTATSTSLATDQTSAIQYERRWLITLNPVIGGTTMTGMRQITVLVTLVNGAIAPGVTVQMSILRP
jgi:Tfp pilus assembly protein PilV